MADKTLSCKDCNSEFVFNESEQAFYKEKGFENDPQRCPDCRAAKKQQRNSGGFRGGNGGGNSGGFRGGNGGEIEGLLFSLQAALGAGIIGYGIGFMTGKSKKQKGQSRR